MQVRVLYPLPRPTAHPEVEHPDSPHFEGIPNHLKLKIAEYLDLDDIGTLLRTTRSLYQLLAPYSYRRAKDERSRDGTLYFLRAVDGGNLTAVRHFIEAGASVNMRDTMEPLRPTALQSSWRAGNFTIAHLLIQHGAN
jgi:hypothetical protein